MAQATTTFSASPSSFRDPAGFVFREDGVYKRAVSLAGKEDYELLMSSGLYERLVADRLLLPHREERMQPDTPSGVHKVLVPDQILHVSYPYEWCFGQLQDAARLTLRIQRAAMDFGLSLKDASAFNVQFRGPEPIFIDSLSFERPRPGPWVAYEQFCRHFLAPLLLMQHVALDFNRFLAMRLDGLPLDLVARLLPYRSYFRLGILVHIHLHARAQRRFADRDGAGRPLATAPLSEARRRAIVDSLASTVAGARRPRAATEWSDYYQQADHYTPEAEACKEQIVARIVERLRPRLVYDMGGNVGRYARQVTRSGAACVCFDIDPLCVEANYQQSRRGGDRLMLPLLMDLSNPSPAVGFDLSERMSLPERSQPDLVMALALIHHLRISANVPLRRIASFFARLAPWLLIEWVPREDVMARRLLTRRSDIFSDYTAEGLAAAFGEDFEPVERVEIAGSPRALLLFRRRAR